MGEYNAQAMADAMVERPVGSLSERVGQLLRGRCYSVIAAREVVTELRDLGREDTAMRFWKAFGSTYRTDDAVIVGLINEVREFEPKPVMAQGG